METGPRPGEPTPGGEVSRWQQFKLDPIGQGGEPRGFSDPEGNHYALNPDEELVFIKSEGGSGRDPFIKYSDGSLLAFERWQSTK